MGPPQSEKVLIMDSTEFPELKDAASISNAITAAQKRVHANRRSARIKPVSKRVDTRDPGKVPQAVASHREFQMMFESVTTCYQYTKAQPVPKPVLEILQLRSPEVAAWWKRTFYPSDLLDITGNQKLTDDKMFKMLGEHDSKIEARYIANVKHFGTTSPCGHI